MVAQSFKADSVSIKLTPGLFLHQQALPLLALDLTTALRPELLPDESVLFLQGAIGLYEGKDKLSRQQNGQVYLTSHRICYVDNEAPREHSVAVLLKDIDRYEFYSGFLKSSPKITLWLKASKRTPFQTSSSPLRSQNDSPAPRTGSPLNKPPPHPPPITWVCPICSFSNPLPPGFDPTTVHSQTPIPPCQTCGIKPPMKHLLKAAISATASSIRRDVSVPIESHRQGTPLSHLKDGFSQGSNVSSTAQCPRCTFENHPSLSTCEMCGAALPPKSMSAGASSKSSTIVRPESPGPLMEHDVLLEREGPEAIKLSFRAGGEKTFYERLKGAMAQRKWLLVSAPSGSASQLSSQFYVPEDGNGSGSGSGSITPESRQRAVGIAGLERLTLEKRRNNEQVISGAFEDLEALMASAKEITALAESMAKQQGIAAGEDAGAAAVLRESLEALGMTTTRDMLGGGRDEIYLSELARTLAEYLTDDRQSVLKKEGGVIALVDLYARFSRANIGMDEVSPADFAKAAKLWEKLRLPIRLRTFKNGLMVVQGRDRTDEKTIRQLTDWLDDFRAIPPELDLPWDWQFFGKGVTAQETAARFGWSVGVAIEELEMAEEHGALCREQGIEGLRFWHNMFPALREENSSGDE